MATNISGKLKILYSFLKPGAPIRYADLEKLGISKDLAVYYVRAGWLERLGNGVYIKPGSEPELSLSIKLLNDTAKDLHLGGKSALEVYGITHYLSYKPITYLYGSRPFNVPEWFSSRFNCKYNQKHLFEEDVMQPLYVGSYEGRGEKWNSVSDPERAVLEMLSEVGLRQSLSEAVEIMESCYTLRSDVMETLLDACRSVKAVRLFRDIAKKISLPVISELSEMSLKRGSASNWVGKDGNTRMILKP